MAVLTVQTIARTGLAPAYAAANAGGDDMPNDGKTFLHVKNASGGSINVTIASNYPSASLPPGTAVANQVVAVPATTGDRMIGPFPQSSFNDANGRCNITYSGVTSLTVAAAQLPS